MAIIVVVPEVEYPVDGLENTSSDCNFDYSSSAFAFLFQILGELVIEISR